MIKRVVWRENDVISLKLRDDLYSLTQMRVTPYLSFFDVHSADGKWSGVDLNEVRHLFTVPVATKRMVPLMVEKVDAAPSREPMPKWMINVHLNFGGDYPFRGGDLIEIDERGETTGRPIMKGNLAPARDAMEIRKYELTNLWVEPEKLKERLIRYFETGVNWDPHKEKVFPGITPGPQGT